MKIFLSTFALVTLFADSTNGSSDKLALAKEGGNENEADPTNEGKPTPGKKVTGQYIIRYSDDLSPDDFRGKLKGLAKRFNRDPVHTYHHTIKGVTMSGLTLDDAAQIANMDGVETVEEDMEVAIPEVAMSKGKADREQAVVDPAQVVPWGISRVSGGATYTGSNAAWIIDSGIQMDHPDLNVDVGRSVSFVKKGKNIQPPDDENGHGTHVAGTVAAIDNEIGVVGVAAGATVIAVRVLNARGGGTLSTMIAGIDHVAANFNEGDVANLSFTGPAGGDSVLLDAAVLAAAEAGLRIAIAAGNEGMDAIHFSPANVNHDNIWTVSAFRELDDKLAGFSNFGSPPVDVSAPGKNIQSTWINGEYGLFSGTSMASPHVAGMLLLGNYDDSGATGGFVTEDPDGIPDPIMVVSSP